jgi:hypothetical protein
MDKKFANAKSFFSNSLIRIRRSFVRLEIRDGDVFWTEVEKADFMGWIKST